MSDIYLAAPTLYCWNSIHPYELLSVCKAHQDNESGELVLETMYSTQDPPPSPKEGFAICRDIKENKWIYLPDYRGKSYWTKEMSWKDPGCPVLYPGELPDGATTVPPQKPYPILRAEIKLAIRQKKQQMRKSGVIVDRIRFDSDYNADLAYITFLDDVQRDPEFTKRWKASDGVWVTMTKDLCLRVRQAVSDHVDNIYKWQERIEVLLSQTKDEDLPYFDIESL